MREILFRGKNKKTNEWVYGSYVNDGHEHPYIKESYDKDTEFSTFQLLASFGYLNEHVYVKEETVGQFTGLLDKNNQRIFEHDIIKFRQYICDKYCFGSVSFENGEFGISWIDEDKDYRFCPLNFDFYEKVEILGNVFDNPNSFHN